MPSGRTSWWRRQSSAMRGIWVSSLFLLIATCIGAWIQSGPSWLTFWNGQATTPTPSSGASATHTPASVISVDTIRDKILLAPDLATAESILHEFWREGHSGFHADHHYDPAGCSAQGYGVAWNVHYDDRFLRDRVLVFSSPQTFTMLPNDNEGGWYAQLCLHSGVHLSADDVGRLQAALLQKRHGGQWSHEIGR